MGTRALTFVYDEQGNAVVNLYRQFDGYIEGHGRELAEFLAGKTLVNGYGSKSTSLANGMGCLAASLVANFKETVGGFYIHAVTETECGQDYEYHVYKDRVEVRGPGSILNPGLNYLVFKGTWAEFAELCKVEA